MTDDTTVKGLSTEQVAQFHENGYLKIGKFLDDAKS